MTNFLMNSYETLPEFDDDSLLLNIDLHNIENVNPNNQKPTNDILNTSLESVVSLRGILSLAAKRNYSQTKDDSFVSSTSDNIIDNSEFKAPVTSTVKKKQSTNSPKSKKSKNAPPNTNNNVLIQRTNSYEQLLHKNMNTMLELEQALVDESYTEPKLSPTKFQTKLDTSPEVSELNQHDSTLMHELKNVFSSQSTLRQNLEHEFNAIENSLSCLYHSVAKNCDDEIIFEMQETSILNHLNDGGEGEGAEPSTPIHLNWTNDSFSKSIHHKILNENKLHDDSMQRILNNTENCAVDSALVDSIKVFTSKGPFYGLPLKVKELLAEAKGITDLYEWQKECLTLPAIKSQKNLIYALPTSGGKTLVAEILLFQELLCKNKNVIFVLPYVSIVQEKIWALAPFQIALNFFVEEYAGNKGIYPPRKRRNRRSVYVATIEKASSLIYSLYENKRLDEIGLVIVDEIHLLGEKKRGAILETLLTTIMFLKENIQIIGMSATIGNINDICEFLKADIYTQNFRPVQLTEYIKLEDNIYKINLHDEKMFQMERTIKNISAENNQKDPDHLGVLVTEVIYGGSCLIFCPTKKNCENVALLLTSVLDKKILNIHKHERQQLCDVMSNDGKICPILKESLPFGVAYHHSGLTQEERVLIEDSFRAGVINVICCTSTLAAGVNLPAQRVILRSPYVGQYFITLSKYKQMIGRAGRAGFGETGESILICSKKDIPQIKSLLMSRMDEANSSLHEDDQMGLKTFILVAIGLNIASTKQDLLSLINHSLLHVQKDKLGVDIEQLVNNCLMLLIKSGSIFPLNSKTNFLETTTDALLDTCKLSVTNHGKAAIKSGIPIEKAKIVFGDLKKAQSSLVLLNSLHLLYLVTPYDLSNQIKTESDIYYNAYSTLNKDELQAAKVIGVTEYNVFRMMRGQPLTTLSDLTCKRFYLTLMLNDLWKDMSVYSVAEKYKVNRGFIQQLMTTAASFAANLKNYCEYLHEFKCFVPLLDELSNRLVHCCTPELLPLMDLPAVKKARAKQLYKAGFTSLQSLASTDPYTLVKSINNLSTRVAIQIINSAKLLLLKKVENLREEAQEIVEINLELDK